MLDELAARLAAVERRQEAMMHAQQAQYERLRLMEAIAANRLRALTDPDTACLPEMRAEYIAREEEAKRREEQAKGGIYDAAH